jgi:hypothetical protein
MFDYAHTARAESTNPKTTMFIAPIEIFQMWLPAMSAAVNCNGKMFETVATLHKEGLDFVSQRWVADMALSQDLSTCRSFLDVCSVYADYFQQAVADYQRQFAEIENPDARGPARPQPKNIMRAKHD